MRISSYSVVALTPSMRAASRTDRVADGSVNGVPSEDSTSPWLRITR